MQSRKRNSRRIKIKSSSQSRGSTRVILRKQRSEQSGIREKDQAKLEPDRGEESKGIRRAKKPWRLNRVKVPVSSLYQIVDFTPAPAQPVF